MERGMTNNLKNVALHCFERVVDSKILKLEKERNMKKVSLLVVFLMLALVATTGYAQVKAGSVHITPNIGMYKFEGSEDMDASIALGLRAGYNFTKYFGVEAFGHWVPTDATILQR